MVKNALLLTVLSSQVFASYFPSLLVTSGEAIAVVFAASALLFALRWPALRLRARSPRVQVAAFAWASPKSAQGDANALWITSLVREELTALRLAPLEALPGASSGAPIVEIVESVGEGIGDKSQLGKAIGRLFRAVFPEAVYQVSGTLKPSSEADKGTIAVQVVDRARRNKTLVSAVLDLADWRENAREAAATAAGALYPQVANRYKGAWGHWRRPVPSELIRVYDEARTHEKRHRLEQALCAYHRALRLDPLNPNLRLRIAMLQERLELYLGAWATYQAIADEPHRGSWKGPNRRVRLLALYRLAILLGNDKVAELWVKPDTEVDAEPNQPPPREALRESLTRSNLLIRRPWLSGPGPSCLTLFAPPTLTRSSAARILSELRDPARRWDEDRARCWLGEQLAPPDANQSAMARVAFVLQTAGLARLEQLDARLRRKPPWRPWRWAEWWRYRPPLLGIIGPREFSLCAVRVSKLLARVRIAASVRVYPEERGRQVFRRVERESRGLRRRWPFPATRPRLPVRWLRPRQRLADRRDDAWQYHYNAACTISTAMVAGRRTELIAAALGQLEEYVHRAGSGQVREQVSWVGGEDDDLTELRGTRQYMEWAAHHLPPGRATRTRIDTARIAARIASDGARAFADSWWARAAHDSAGAELVATWWREEARAWHRLGDIFDKHPSWKQRGQGIDALQDCLRAGGEERLIDAAHRPEDREETDQPGVQLLELLLRLTAANPPCGSPPIEVRSWAKSRASIVRDKYETDGTTRIGHGLTTSEREEALRAFRIWNRLADALEAELNGRDNGSFGGRITSCLEEIRDDLPQAAAGS